ATQIASNNKPGTRTGDAPNIAIANAKAAAVWPDGNEKRSRGALDCSSSAGRVRRTTRLTTTTNRDVTMSDKAAWLAIDTKPGANKATATPMMTMSGSYMRQSVRSANVARAR